MSIWAQKSNKTSHEKCYIWNRSTCTWENGKNVRSIIGDWVITPDKVIEVTKTAPTKTFLTKNTNYCNKNWSNKF